MVSHRINIRPVHCTVWYTLYCTYHEFVNYGVIAIMEDRKLPLSRQFTVRCTVRCQAGTAIAKMASERPLHPKTSHFCSPVCLSHVRTPHNASLNDPEAGLGLHQLRGWHCQCKVGLRNQKGLSAPNTSHFHLQHAPLMC